MPGSGGTTRASRPATAAITTTRASASTEDCCGLDPPSIRRPDRAATPMSACCAIWLPTVPTSPRLVTSAPTIAPTVLAA